MNSPVSETRNADFDVIIVGFGPSGATFANLMARRGWSVAIFDQAAGIYDKPRAITADQEVMRVFQECGLAEQIAESTSPHPGTDFVGVEGQVIKRFYPAPPPHILGWEPAWMFLQPTLEASLREGLKNQAKVATFLSCEFVGYEQDDQLVTAEFRHTGDGSSVRYSARYLVGADGGRSAVRTRMEATIEDLAFDEWWIVVDALLCGPVELPERCVQYCRPSRPGTYIVGPDDLRRWEIKMLPGETVEDFESEEAILSVLSAFVDVTHLKLSRIAIYRFHALVVNEWRNRRVFLMGDAAHQMPPFLGQGLCAGVRDAINLAWKMDGVERCGFTPRLLDTYSEERKPHVRTIVSLAKSFGLIIGELDLESAIKRDQKLESDLAEGRAETVRQKFIPGLTTGFIGKDEDGNNRLGAGELFVQPWVHSAGRYQRLDDLLPLGFLLVAVDKEAFAWFDNEAQTIWRRIKGCSVLIADNSVADSHEFTYSFQERDGIFSRWIEQLGARAVLVRPDRYVFGAIRSSSELRSLLSQATRGLFDGGLHSLHSGAGTDLLECRSRTEMG